MSKTERKSKLPEEKINYFYGKTGTSILALILILALANYQFKLDLFNSSTSTENVETKTVEIEGSFQEIKELVEKLLQLDPEELAKVVEAYHVLLESLPEGEEKEKIAQILMLLLKRSSTSVYIYIQKYYPLINSELFEKVLNENEENLSEEEIKLRVELLFREIKVAKEFGKYSLTRARKEKIIKKIMELIAKTPEKNWQNFQDIIIETSCVHLAIIFDQDSQFEEYILFLHNLEIKKFKRLSEEEISQLIEIIEMQLKYYDRFTKRVAQAILTIAKNGSGNNPSKFKPDISKTVRENLILLLDKINDNL